MTQQDSQCRKEVGKGSPARWIPGHHFVSPKPPATLAVWLCLVPTTFQPFLPKATAADRFLQGQAPSAYPGSPGTPRCIALGASSCWVRGHPHRLGEWPSLCGPKVHPRNEVRSDDSLVFSNWGSAASVQFSSLLARDARLTQLLCEYVKGGDGICLAGCLED